MTRRETRFTNILRSRGIGIILALTGVWMVLRCPVETRWSFALLPEWIGEDIVRGINILGVIATAVALVVLNRSYNLLKTLSVFFAAYFIFTTCATPEVFSGHTSSVMLALTVILDTWLLFSIYNTRASDRRIFLIFTLLSAGALFDLRFLFFVPVFVAGLAQMKILKFKKIVAAVIGLLTPPWIVWGLALMPLPTMPHVFFTPPALLLEQPGGVPFLCTVGVTLAVGFIAGTVSLVRILGFNARARAYNSFIAMLGIVTGLMALINFTSLTTYITLLNACVAMQVGHFFRATANRRGYIVVVLLLAAYTALYVWTAID